MGDNLTVDSLVIVCNSRDNSLGIARLSGGDGALSRFADCPLPDVGLANGAYPMAVSPDRRTLYVGFRGSPPEVLSFAIDYENCRLNYLGRSPLPGSMAYISTDESGRFLFSASYGDGTFAVNAIGDDGIAGEILQVEDAGPKAHCTMIGRGNKIVYVTSVDDERVIGYGFDAKTGAVTRLARPAAQLTAGNGPRHMVLHPHLDFAYVVNQERGTVNVFSLDEEGAFHLVQSVDIFGPELSGSPLAADIHLTPDGALLYASERTSNTLAGYKVDAVNGRLTEVVKIEVADTPRGFCIDPYGRWLLLAGENSAVIETYAIDRQTGDLQKTRVSKCGSGPNWIEILKMPTTSSDDFQR